MGDLLEPVFAELRARMLRAGAAMDATTDAPGNLVLKTVWLEPGKTEGAWFGAVQLKKNYVSCHLMPIYADAGLRAKVPAELEKRMQGKSCFNFKTPEPELFDRLEALIAACAKAWAEPGAAKPH
jgi:hypothetical protein